MKRINVILFALFLLLSAGQLGAQEQKPYKPAAEFHGDTVRYLEYNYRMRAEQSRSKTVGEILKELEYPVLYIVEDIMKGSKLVSLSLSVRQVGNEPSPLKDYYIIVFFKNPPLISDFNALYDRRNPIFTTQIYDFIKDLEVSRVGFNSYMSKDPATLKRMKEIREENDEKGRRAAEKLKQLRSEREKKKKSEL